MRSAGLSYAFKKNDLPPRIIGLIANALITNAITRETSEIIILNITTPATNPPATAASEPELKNLTKGLLFVEPLSSYVPRPYA